MQGRHGAIYLIYKIFPAISSLLILAAYTRLLTPEQYGIYSLTILVSAFFNAIMLQWFIRGVGRNLPDCKSNEEVAILLNTSRLMFLIISFFLIFLSLFLHYLSPLRDLIFILYFVGFIAASQAWFDFNLVILNANLKPVAYGAILSIKSFTLCFIGIFVVYMGHGVEGACLSLVGSLFFSSFLFSSTWKNISIRQVDLKVVKKLWEYGSPLIFIFLFEFIVNYSDRFFIRYFMGDHSVGIYSASYDFTQYGIGNILVAFNLATFPLIVRAYSETNKNDFNKKLGNSFLFLIMAITPITLGIISLSENLSDIFIGESFSNYSSQIVSMVSVSMFLIGIKSCYFDYAFQLTKSTRILALIIFISSIINLILNFMLIPIYGYLGATLSTVVSCFFGLIGSIFIGRKLILMPIPPLSDVLKVILSSVLMVVIVGFIEINNVIIETLAKFLVGIIIYTLSLYILNISDIRKYLNNLNSSI